MHFVRLLAEVRLKRKLGQKMASKSFRSTKGQLISKCPYEKSVWTNTNENISKISALEVYYFKVNTKREFARR